MEVFRAKKCEEKAKLEHHQTSNNAAGISSSIPNKLVLELATQKEKILVTPLASPTIPQVDGVEEEEIVRYAFESSYHVDDVIETLKEIFDENEVNFALESREQTAPLSACDRFVICLTVSTRGKLSWPHMREDQAVVFEKLKKIL